MTKFRITPNYQQIKQIIDLVDSYELSLAKGGLMTFDRVQNNSSVVKDFLYSNEDEINKIIKEEN